jgi:hypothetical protein
VVLPLSDFMADVLAKRMDTDRRIGSDSVQREQARHGAEGRRPALPARLPPPRADTGDRRRRALRRERPASRPEAPGRVGRLRASYLADPLRDYRQKVTEHLLSAMGV